jgi:hypothetical protein
MARDQVFHRLHANIARRPIRSVKIHSSLFAASSKSLCEVLRTSLIGTGTSPQFSRAVCAIETVIAELANDAAEISLGYDWRSDAVASEVHPRATPVAPTVEAAANIWAAAERVIEAPVARNVPVPVMPHGNAHVRGGRRIKPER